MTAHELFKGGGEMGARIRQLDWSQTPLGPVATWPQSLITAVTIMLGSQFPMMVHWGPELVHFYNDGYATILQNKHPGALGQPAEPWWREMWPFLLTIFEPVLAGETTYFENSLVLPNRQGFIEEAYFTFSHSPIYDEQVQVAGIFVTALETTTTVLQQRRLSLLSHLTAQMSLSTQPAEAAQHLIAALATNQADMPFALLYDHEPATAQAQLRAWFGLPAGEPTAPSTLPADQVETQSWPLADVLRSGQPLLVQDLPARFTTWPTDAAPAWPTRALLLPLHTMVTSRTASVLIVGLSARRPLDEAYHAFLTLVADYAGRALTRVATLHEAQCLNQALREANASLDSFVHIAAHDLKAPANNLARLLTIYHEEASGASQEHILSLVEQEVHRLTNTIEGLLQVLHSQHDAAGSPPERVDLAAVYTTVRAELAELLQQQQGQLTANFAAPSVYFPRIYLESILKNLVSNALKYRDPARPPLVQVGSHQQAANLVLTVTDNGRGINLVRDRERLFKPFIRLTSDGQGSGLGLHLIQAMIQQQGGSLDVTSTPGQGTTFTVILPSVLAV
jgi:signal transduction histidine kinase